MINLNSKCCTVLEETFNWNWQRKATTTYVPFGKDWYGYFMRRLAESPQNLNLMVKQVFDKKTNTIIGLVFGAFLLGRYSKRKRK